MSYSYFETLLDLKHINIQRSSHRVTEGQERTKPKFIECTCALYEIHVLTPLVDLSLLNFPKRDMQTRK